MLGHLTSTVPRTKAIEINQAMCTNFTPTYMIFYATGTKIVQPMAGNHQKSNQFTLFVGQISSQTVYSMK